MQFSLRWRETYRQSNKTWSPLLMIVVRSFHWAMSPTSSSLPIVHTCSIRKQSLSVEVNWVLSSLWHLTNHLMMLSFSTEFWWLKIAFIMQNCLWFKIGYIELRNDDLINISCLSNWEIFEVTFHLKMVQSKYS